MGAARPMNVDSTTTSRGADDLNSRLSVVTVGGAPLHAITEQECIDHILHELDAGRGGWVATHNLDHLRRLQSDPAFASMCATAALRVADGMPLVWASRLAGQPLPERVAGSSLIHTLTAAAAAANRSVYFLGGNPGTAKAAAATLRQRYPRLHVAGAACPPVGFDRNSHQMDAVIRAMTTAQPDIVYVALGSPKQELLIARVSSSLPRSWFLGVGISFSFVSGDVRRAPLWMQRNGLEWLHRLIQEPSRLAGRYLIQGLPFAAGLLVQSALDRRRALGRGTHALEAAKGTLARDQ